MTDEAVPGLAGLAETVHRHGAAASIQLGHAGPVAAGTSHRGLAPSRVFAPQAMRYARAATDDDLARVGRAFVDAARRSVDAGFDALELHFGHGYLVSAFLSPRLNRRTDRWGGTIENRARLARQVALDVREAVGDQVAVIAKFNMADGVRGGLWLDQSLVVAAFGAETGSTDTTGSDSTASATVAAIAPGHGGRRHHRPGWHRASDDDLEVDTRARTPRGCRVGECESRDRPWHCTEAGPDGGAPCRPA